MTTPVKRCALYFHYDADDVLLYVGISETLVARGKQHAKGSEWVRYAVRAEAVWHPSRDAALEAEEQAIKRLQPVFNKQHNDTPQAKGRRAEYIAAGVTATGWRTIDAKLDGDVWWGRRIHVDIDVAAAIILNRDAYVDHHLGQSRVKYGIHNAAEIRACANAGLEAIWASGKWNDRERNVAATDRYAYLYVPVDLIDMAITALESSESTGDPSAIIELTAALERRTRPQRKRSSDPLEGLPEIASRDYTAITKAAGPEFQAACSALNNLALAIDSRTIGENGGISGWFKIVEQLTVCLKFADSSGHRRVAPSCPGLAEMSWPHTVEVRGQLVHCEYTCHRCGGQWHKNYSSDIWGCGL